MDSRWARPLSRALTRQLRRCAPYDSTTRFRRAVTVVELLVASSVIALILGALAMMATGLRTQQESSQQYAMAMMHARTVLQRIERACRGAYANATFPGFVVFAEQVGSDLYPDVLVVWRPTSRPSDPTGLPLWKELVIFGWNRTAPSELLEITAPNDSTRVPALTDVASWRSRLDSLRAGNGSQRVVLTDQLRVAQPPSAPEQMRGVVRFDPELQPSTQQWEDWKAGRLAWTDLSWPQGLFGTSYGVRQNRCRIELQLREGSSGDPQRTLVFYGSAAIYFTVTN